jgi:hypothetical protein
MDIELARTSVRFDQRRLNKPISSPALLSMDESISFRMLLEHGTTDEHSLHDDTKLFDEEGGIDLAQHFDLMDPHTQSIVLNPSSKIPTRCLAVAEFFGEMEAIRFWTLVDHAIHKHKSIDVILGGQQGISPLPSPMIQSTARGDGSGSGQSSPQPTRIVVESALHSIDDEKVTISEFSDGYCRFPFLLSVPFLSYYTSTYTLLFDFETENCLNNMAFFVHRTVFLKHFDGESMKKKHLFEDIVPTCSWRLQETVRFLPPLFFLPL